MSSDFLEDVEDCEGTSVLLTMRASGFAQLIIMEADKLSEDQIIVEKEGKIVCLNLMPDEKGWKNAEMIADALKEWARHTKGLKNE